MTHDGPCGIADVMNVHECICMNIYGRAISGPLWPVEFRSWSGPIAAEAEPPTMWSLSLTCKTHSA